MAIINPHQGCDSIPLSRLSYRHQLHHGSVQHGLPAAMRTCATSGLGGATDKRYLLGNGGTVMSNTRDVVDVREAFHIAKLALFNVRLLNEFENARLRSKEIDELIEARAASDGIARPISLMSQAVFLQFAYVCMVWLWEIAKAERSETEIVDLVQQKFHFDPVIGKVKGERNVTEPKDFIRLVRNAISHARVIVQDDAFILSDIDCRKEKSKTVVQLSWAELGQLSEAVLFAMNNKIYP